MFRPNFIDINPVELKYFPFMTNSNKCNGICNVLSPKICVPKETKDIILKAFDMIINKKEPKTMTKKCLMWLQMQIQ